MTSPLRENLFKRGSTTKILKPLNYRYFFTAFKSPLVLLKLFLKNRLQPKRPIPRLLHHCPEYYTCTVKINFSCITVPVAVVSITISLYLCVCVQGGLPCRLLLSPAAGGCGLRLLRLSFNILQVSSRVKT